MSQSNGERRSGNGPGNGRRAARGAKADAARRRGTAKPQAAVAVARAALETLEDRRLMSSVVFSDQVLTVQADSASEPLKLWVDYDKETDRLKVFADGQREQSFARSEVRTIRVIGSEKSDSVYIEDGVSVRTEVQGRGGDDDVTTGCGDDAVDAGAGDDHVHGRGGRDSVSGGDGDDKVYGGQGDDDLNGGAGNDRVEGAAGRDTLAGGDGDDLLLGESEDDVLDGGRGEDRLRGSNGDDMLQGGEDDDSLKGGHGEDTLVGSGGMDAVNGGPDDDRAPGMLPAEVQLGQRDATDDSTPPPSDGPVDDDGEDDDSNNNGGGGTDDNQDAQAPALVIEFIKSAGVAGHTAHVSALKSDLKAGDPVGAAYEWDFGDPGSRYNKLAGWNAAHTYDKPGTYTVTLTVTNAAGKRSTATGTVNVAADRRRVIYVDAQSGSDASAGMSPTSAVRTLERAAALAGDDTKLLLRNGQSHDVGETIYLSHKNFAIGTYGDGHAARVVKARAAASSGIFQLAPRSEDVVVAGLEFDSVWGLDSSYGNAKVPARGMTVYGTNVTVRDCTFRNVTDAVNNLGKPTGLLVQDCVMTGEMRGTGIWSEGTDHVYLGNTMRDSKHEHLIRASDSGVERVLIAHNDLSRPSNRKGSIELRKAKWFYVTDNRVAGGTLRVGLQEDAAYTPGWEAERTHWGVVQNNRTERIFINFRPGVEHVAFRNNVVRLDGVDNGYEAILVECVKPGYDHVRKTVDVRIENNTVVNNDRNGRFLKVNGHATDLVVKNNLYVAPNLVATGGGASGAVTVADAGGLSGFKEISGNVWPAVALGRHQDGLNYVSDDWFDHPGGFQSPAEWEAHEQVRGDVYRDVNVGDVYRVRVGDVEAGSTLRVAA